VKHLDPQGDLPTADQLRELVSRYREHSRADLGGSRDCLGCGSSVRDSGRWWFTECSYTGVRIAGRFHHHIAKPHGCGGPEEGCPIPQQHESVEITWGELRALLVRDQLALPL
jgi:hypothetical protein